VLPLPLSRDTGKLKVSADARRTSLRGLLWCVAWLVTAFHHRNRRLQPFSQKSRTATVPKVFQIGLCGVADADLELFWKSWSVGFLGERLYVEHPLTLNMS